MRYGFRSSRSEPVLKIIGRVLAVAPLKAAKHRAAMVLRTAVGGRHRADRARLPLRHLPQRQQLAAPLRRNAVGEERFLKFLIKLILILCLLT